MRIMNSNTALVMFAVIAAFGFATAILVVPLVPQAQAQGEAGGCTFKDKNCRSFGQSVAEEHSGVDVPRGPPP